MEPVKLRSSRLVLSTPTLEDVDAIVRYCQDPLFERYLTTPWPYTRDDGVVFVEQFVPDGWAADRDCTWGIRSPDGRLLGMISWRIRGDVGFWIGAEHRRRGYTVEALGSVCDWVFADRGADHIDWETLPGNFASAHVARAAGFRFTGTAPVLVPRRDGSHPDSWHGELRREDDRSIKKGWPL
ncbi:MAG: GNAT family N-acetyltransferase [Actinomycetota bacterium]|nr:GNAT family N-acetyltransferase [Actinomycetota bacterium]